MTSMFSESHEPCYLLMPAEVQDGPPNKKRRTAFGQESREKSFEQPLPRLLNGDEKKEFVNLRYLTFERLWRVQHARLETVLRDASADIIDRVTQFIIASEPSNFEDQILSGFIPSGLATSSSGSIFPALCQRLESTTQSSIIGVAASQYSSLKSFLRSIIQDAIHHTVPQAEEDEIQAAAHEEARLLNYDLQLLHNRLKDKALRRFVVYFKESEALDGGVLAEIVDVLNAWKKRIPFVFVFEVSTSIELFQQKLSRRTVRAMRGESFETKDPLEVLESLFRAVTAHEGPRSLWIGPSVSRLLLDRQTEYTQSADEYIFTLKYVYMMHFFNNALAVMMDESNPSLSKAHLSEIRGLNSFKRHIQDLLDDRENSRASQLLGDDKFLQNEAYQLLESTRSNLEKLMNAIQALALIHSVTSNKLNFTWSIVYLKAMSGDLAESPLVRELILSVKRLPSDVMVKLLDTLGPLGGLDNTKRSLKELVRKRGSLGPLRSEHDLNPTLRTTVIAQKVSLSKQKAALSAEDAEYSKLVTRIELALREFFSTNITPPKELPLHEILLVDSKALVRDAFGPMPRQAMERALSNPYDYLACDCCAGGEGLASTQPATAILYQLYLEAGGTVNTADLLAAFQLIVRPELDTDEGHEEIMCLFYRALAELRYLGMLKGSRRKTDHLVKMRWKGL